MDACEGRHYCNLARVRHLRTSRRLRAAFTAVHPEIEVVLLWPNDNTSDPTFGQLLSIEKPGVWSITALDLTVCHSEMTSQQWTRAIGVVTKCPALRILDLREPQEYRANCRVQSFLTNVDGLNGCRNLQILNLAGCHAAG